jgi:hypothetical protein
MDSQVRRREVEHGSWSRGACSRSMSRDGVGSRVMPERPVRLYGIALSHPVLAARGMLDHKGLAYRYIELP